MKNLAAGLSLLLHITEEDRESMNRLRFSIRITIMIFCCAEETARYIFRVVAYKLIITDPESLWF